MNKFLTATAVGLFAFAAHAQSNPPGAAVPPATPGIATGQAEQKAEARKDARAPGQVQAQGGDTVRSAEGGKVAGKRDANAAAIDGAKNKRDQKRPHAAHTSQGSTPK